MSADSFRQLSTMAEDRVPLLRLLVPGVLMLVLLGYILGDAAIDSPKIISTLPFDPDCDLRAGACMTRIPGSGEVSFAIEPRTIPLLAELQLAVTVKDFPVDKVEVDLNGLGMNMGFNRVKLDSIGNGRFSGTGQLSVCTLDIMEWEAKVLLYQKDDVTVAPYRFITVKNNGG
jgi:hypothetical protein